MLGVEVYPQSAAWAAGRAADEAYARLKVTADAYDVETARARGKLLVEVQLEGNANTEKEKEKERLMMDTAPGVRVLADGCAALADAFEAHLAASVVCAAGAAAANAAPASVAERFAGSAVDLYETTSDRKLATAIQLDDAMVTVPPHQAVIVVLLPANSLLQRSRGQVTVNSTVVRYSTAPPPPPSQMKLDY